MNRVLSLSLWVGATLVVALGVHVATLHALPNHVMHRHRAHRRTKHDPSRKARRCNIARRGAAKSGPFIFDMSV